MVKLKRDNKVQNKAEINKKDTFVCINKECKLRKAGCKGSQNCPGYKKS